MTLKRLRWFWSHERDDNSFENTFAYKPDDVIIVSYPKSGSTWVRFTLANLLSQFLERHEEVDFLRAQLLVPEVSSHASGNGVNFEALPRPRIMRSHALYNSRFPKVVYLLRDPRDVLVSYYYHFKKFYEFDGTLLDFLRSDLRKIQWDEHVNSWIFQSPSLANTCVIRYEHMLRDTFLEFQKIVHFSGLTCMPEDIRSAIEKSSFQRLRDLEERKGLGYVEQQNTQIRFIREGRSGAWQEHFGPAEKTYVKEKFGNILIRAGYESSLLW